MTSLLPVTLKQEPIPTPSNRAKFHGLFSQPVTQPAIPQRVPSWPLVESASALGRMMTSDSPRDSTTDSPVIETNAVEEAFDVEYFSRFKFPNKLPRKAQKPRGNVSALVAKYPSFRQY